MLVFYDIECVKYNSLIVLKDIDKREIAHFWSKGYCNEDEPNGFESLHSLIKGNTLVAYNNYHYDDIMITQMMNGATQKRLKLTNDNIINGVDVKYKIDPDIHSLDCFQQIDVSYPSLKLIEGNMGHSIIESSIDFNIDRYLTEEEKEEMYYYCVHDVDELIDVYKLRHGTYFKVKEQLVEMTGNPSCYRWNTTTIAANLLLSKPLEKWDKPRGLDKHFRNIEGIPEEVWKMWEEVNYWTEANTKNVKVSAFGMDFVFGFGGLHGVHSTKKKFGKTKLLDVGSMYPSIIILLRALGEATDLYNQMRLERLSIKKSDPDRANALKLILNSVYGLMKSIYSLLYNPMAAVSVCIFGQMALFDLCRRLHDEGYVLMNANTDGIAFEDSKLLGNAYESVWHEWEDEWGLSLELDVFDFWYQKDVNNYVATHDGKIKTKGGEVSKYDKDKFFSNNNIRITHIALVEYIVNGKDPLDTIIDNLDNPLLFQYVLKAGKTFKGVYDQHGNKLQNVNRVFALNKKFEGTKLYKVRQDDGYVNFPDVPENMWLFNDDLSKIEDFERKIDISFYYNLCKKKIKEWEE